MTIKTIGIITEYNPFHLGHRYHVMESRRLLGATHCVAVMSGSFVQRGEPALLDKWTRAACAVQNGVDLVLEMPVIFAVSSAEYFATAGVYLLDRLGVTDTLSFGSESGSLDALKAAATDLSHQASAWRSARKNQPALSYPALRAKLLDETGLESAVTPNDILGIEYLKALRFIGSELQPFTLRRQGHGYHDPVLEQAQPETVFSSASAIRESLRQGTAPEAVAKSVPKETFEALKHHANAFPEPLKRYEWLRYRLSLHTPGTLESIHDMEPGLPERILKAAAASEDYEGLVSAIKSKRHTRARIERVLAKILLDIPQNLVGKNREVLPAYLRVLAFNERGRQLLKISGDTARLPLISNLSPHHLEDPILAPQLRLDVRATDLRAWLTGDPRWAQDLKRPPVYVRSQSTD